MSSVISRFFFLILLVSISQKGLTQTSFSVHLLESYRIEENNFGPRGSEWSQPGIEGQVVFHFNDKVGLQLRVGYARYSGERETVLPAFIGPEWSIPIADNLQIAAHINVGTSAVIGNDYAGFFGGAETGFQLSGRNRVGLIGGVNWAKHFVFHPSEFDAIKLFAGWRF